VKRCLNCSAAFESRGWRCPGCGHEPRALDGIVLQAPELIDGDGTDADYPIDALVRAEDSHFWFRSRAALIASMLARYFPNARSFMEIGAGAGGVLLAIRQDQRLIRLVGSELLLRGLHQASRRVDGVELIQMDARRIPFTAEFDVIGAFDVIEHIDDDAAVLDRVCEALVPGGGVIVTVPQHPWLWTAVDELSGHRRRYTRRDLVGKMTAAGFRMLRVTSFTSFALPLMAAARLRPRKAKIVLSQELAIPQPLNRFLLGVGVLERAIIRGGMSLPMGGSLLAVGVRR
jgi:SAM-dependent methyltransferase